MDQIRPKELKRLYHFFYDINKKAYKKIWLLPNQVLSKSLDWGDSLNKYLFNKHGKLSFFRLLFYMVYSYLRNFYALFCYILKKISFDLSGSKFQQFDNLYERTVFIDTYFLINQILKNNNFSDNYFPGLSGALQKKKKQFVYTPKFFGPDNPFKFYKALKILKNAGVPVMTEFQGFKWVDFIKLIVFILFYPICILKTAFSIKEDSFEAVTVKNALCESLRSNGVIGYSRYLFGCRLAYQFPGPLKCISWYENQAMDKCFYKGLRTINRKVFIYGAQLLIKPSGLLNLIPDGKEEHFGVLPDVILTNGAYFIPDNTSLNYRVGPSLRYQNVFKKQVSFNSNGDILILLPYFLREIDRILRIASTIELPDNRKFMIKFHPTTNTALFNHYGKYFKFTEKNLYELFCETSLVIGAETGSLVEAVTQGIPAIHLEKTGEFSYNPLPEIGKGIVWDIAKDKNDVERLIHVLTDNVKNDEDSVLKFAMEYRQKLFNKADEESIIDAFDL
jgi:hypothetical protein